MAQRSFWEKHILPYFMFTKGERNGILILLVLLALTWLIPSLLPQKPIALQPEELRLIDSFEQARPWPASDSDRAYQRYRVNDKSRPGTQQEGNTSGEQHAFTLRHAFDPNSASDATWASTGLPARTIRTIQRYLAKGGRFRKPEDLQKIYGLSNQDYQTLEPYLRIDPGDDKHHYTSYNRSPGDSGRYARTGQGYQAGRRFGQHGTDQNSAGQNGGGQNGVGKNGVGKNSVGQNGFGQNGVGHKEIGPTYPSPPGRQRRILDVNEADSADWESLPGIGPVLARRIILFRSGLGGFSSVEQVGEVYGLADSVFRMIRPRLVAERKDRIIPLEINRASQSDLEKHPYISRKLAALIVAYRAQHGPFSRADELLAIPLVTPELLKQLEPYLSFN